MNLIGGVGGEGNNNTFTTPGGGGGSSSLGGGGRTSTISLSVVNGQAPGSGGGGIYGEAGPAANGGIGADGAVIIQY